MMGAVSEGSSPDLLEHLAKLLDRATSVSQFWKWFGRAQAGIEMHGSDDEVDLASLVELRFAEYTGDHITAEELLQALAADLDREYPHLVAHHRGVA